MKKIKMALHTKILIALVLGVIFGAIFPVQNDKLKIEYVNQSGKIVETQIEEWKSFELIGEKIEQFSENDRVKIVRHAENQKSEYDIRLLNKDSSEKYYSNIHSIKRVETIATIIKPIGDLFIRLLMFLAVPLVIATLITGSASLGDVRKLGRLGGKTIGIYIFTTALAITIGVAGANIIQPGSRIAQEKKQNLIAEYELSLKDKQSTSENTKIDIVNFLVQVVPKNPFQAIANGNMLQLIFFAVMLGITLTFIPPEKAKPVISFFDGFTEAMIKMVDIFMLIAPYGVFALIAATVAGFGYEIILPLFWYMLVVIVGLLIQTVVVYSLLLKGIGRVSIRSFFANVKSAQVVGFSTSSSAATLPVTMRCVESMGVKKEIASFVLPLGATINMDGTALYQGVAAVFIAQVYGVDLSLAQQLSIIFTAVLASIGTAPVPGLGIIMLVMILQSVGIPAEGVALILGVDRILDMMRTVTNVTGDSAVAATIGALEERAMNR